MKGLLIILAFAILLSDISFAQQCDYKVEIIADSNEFEKEDFKWRMRATKIEGKPTNITGRASIEDLSGKTVKSYKPWTSAPISKQKTSSEYTPNLKPGEYKIKANINVECDDTNKDDNADRKEIKIKGEIEETKNSKSEDAKSNEIENADSVADKTNNEETMQTNQNAIKTKLPKKSAPTEETDNIIYLNKNGQKSKQAKITPNTLNSPQIVYKSSNEKAKEIILVSLLVLSVLLNIILIWKR